MTAARLGMYLPQFITNAVTEEQEIDEVELGFDSMLSCDVVSFLIADYVIGKPLTLVNQDQTVALDEYELAMI